jgi:two-component system KDP operon response regulator KdpE
MSQIRVLVVEDDPGLQRFLVSSLKKQGYLVVPAGTGAEALSLARSHNPDLVLLDLGLPDLDGLEVLKGIRALSQVPVVILSARNQERVKAEALDTGADDYLTKPFGVVELAARLRVAVRHLLRAGAAGPVVVSGELRVDLEARKVTRHGEEVHLTPLEFRLLAALARRYGKVVTHQQLLAEVWGSGQVEQTQYLHLYMRQLRHKMEDDPKRPRHFRTESGVGYRMEVDPEPVV